MIIEKAGHECEIENNGRSGLKRINEQKWDCIILDLAMPDFTGYDVIDQLEKDGTISHNKIVVFTAVSVTDTDILKLTGRGIHACLRKPASITEIASKIGINLD